jgi:hypothetical protein
MEPPGTVETAMALSKADKKMKKLTDAVLTNPDSNQAWAALVSANAEAACALRDFMVATGRMQLAA